jgi:sulfate permease, SulP family
MSTTVTPASAADLLALLKDGGAFFTRPVRVIRGYDPRGLRPDLIAGLTVAMVVVPQAMAYALIAELPPQMGLYTAIVAAIVAALWGSSNQLQTGPTNAASLLVLSVLTGVAASGSPEYIAAAGLLAVMVGVLRTGMGLARLGMLVNFVSDSVIVGFTAGAGVLIAGNQLRNLLRLSGPSYPDLVDTLSHTALSLPQTHLPSLLTGIATAVVIVVLRRIRPSLPGPLIALVLAAGANALLGAESRFAIRVVGAIPATLPPIAHLPLLNLQLIGQLSTGALALAAIGLVEALSIARSIASQTGQRLDSNQEFVGQGLANIAAGILSGFPCSGSFTRSAVNFKTGAKTPLAAVFSGVCVLAAMLLFARYAARIPLSALAGVLMVTAFGLVDRKAMARVWRGPADDRIIMVVTLLSTLLLPLQFAVLTGILISLAAYLLRTATPRVRMVLPDPTFGHFTHQPDRPCCPQLGIIEVLGDLYFGAIHHVEEVIRANLAANPGQRFLLLRMQSVEHCDISGIGMLEAITRQYRGKERNGDVYMTRVRGPVAEVMRETGFAAELSADHFLPSDEALGHLFHRVLDPAICVYECPVAAFKECQTLPKSLHETPNGIHVTLPMSPDGAPLISAEELWRSLHAGYGAHFPILLDVREPREFRRGHIPQAISCPLPALLEELNADAAPIPRDRKIIFICQGGRRSARVAALLHGQGYQQVAALAGGMLAWRASQFLEAVDAAED